MYVLNDPQYRRMQAEEMRALARGIRDHVTREAMRRIASDYEVLAKRAKERLASVTHEHD
jgi:hypothetical protein